MAKAKLNLNRKDDSELLTFTQAHIAAMAGNANFPSPLPDTGDFQALYDGYEVALDEAALAQQTAKQKTLAKDAARAALETGLNQRAGYVDSVSAGVEAMILTSNFPVADAPSPIGPLPAPLDFLATMGDMAGEIDLTWSRVYGAGSYVIQQSPYATPRVWTHAGVVSQSKTTIGGCPSGQLCVFRVAAVGAAGQGPWSDESVKMAP